MISEAPQVEAIDIAALFGPDTPERDACDAAILAAASDLGFMTITGLPGSVLSPATRAELLRLFALSQADKRRLYKRNFEPANPNLYRGYFPVTPGLATYKEGIDLGPDLAFGAGGLTTGDPLGEATPLPDDPRWQQAAADYYRAMDACGRAILAALARGLGLDPALLLAAFEQPISTLRLIRYPPRTKESFGDLGSEVWIDHERHLIGKPHVDSGFITLLAQNGVAGLQAQTRAGDWLDIPPTDGQLAVNFGQLLERWTGGRIRATLHRIWGRGEERFSIPFFFEPGIAAVIRPLPLSGAQPFEPFVYGDYLWEVTTKFPEQAGLESLRPPRGLPADER
jgi:isopenicillin N synthase-like dioxygenase